MSRTPVSSSQAGLNIAVLVQCTLVAILDGFDTQLIAFIAPILSSEWQLSGTETGQLLTAGMAGLMLGTIGLGPISDRIGRRPQLLFCVLLFALCTIASAASTSMIEMFCWRLLTGLGLGGAVVSCYALAAEFASPARFGISVSIVKAGFPIGATLGAIISPFLIIYGGWRFVPLVAGVLPLLLFPILYFRLPESPGFLAQHGGKTEPLSLRSLLPSRKPEPIEGQSRKTSVLTSFLFSKTYAGATLLLWAICFLNLLTVYAFVLWLPSLLQIKGFSLTVALHASACYTVGGIVGGVGMSAIIPRYGPARVLGTACLTGLVAASALSMSTSVAACFIWVTVAGAAISGTQFGTVVLLAGVYPTSIRSTGISWALGVGRIGGILAPMLGGLAIDAGFSANQILQALGLPLLINTGLLVLLSRSRAPLGMPLRE